MSQRTKIFSLPGWLSGLVQRVIVFALLWWILVKGHPGSFWYGIPVVIITSLVSMAIHPGRSRRWRIKGFVRFLPFFLWQSLQGGFDVARRVFDPRLPIAPSFITYSIRLTDEGARIFLAGTISLLPGTLSAELEGANLNVHVLDDSQPVLHKLLAVEERIAELYGSPQLSSGDETASGDQSS